MGYQPDEPHLARPQRAIVVRVLFWGLYKRALEGAYIYESWFWGAYRRVSVVVQPAQLSPETKVAFSAIGGQLGPLWQGTLPRPPATTTPGSGTKIHLYGAEVP